MFKGELEKIKKEDKKKKNQVFKEDNQFIIIKKE
jgi:hypothetical protein